MESAGLEPAAAEEEGGGAADEDEAERGKLKTQRGLWSWSVQRVQGLLGNDDELPSSCR